MNLSVILYVCSSFFLSLCRFVLASWFCFSLFAVATNFWALSSHSLVVFFFNVVYVYVSIDTVYNAQGKSFGKSDKFKNKPGNTDFHSKKKDNIHMGCLNNFSMHTISVHYTKLFFVVCRYICVDDKSSSSLSILGVLKCNISIIYKCI